jgi:hypothetical protein
MTLTEACTNQAVDELRAANSYTPYWEYIDSMSNFELLQFLERVNTNYGKDIL